MKQHRHIRWSILALVLILCLYLVPRRQTAIIAVTGGSAGVATAAASSYTVEFTYNNMEYVLQGGGEIELSELLPALGLSENVQSWEVSNPGLFDVVSDEASGTPRLISLQPFDTTEWLKVRINGAEYEITVTDDELTNTVPAPNPPNTAFYSDNYPVSTIWDSAYSVTADTYVNARINAVNNGSATKPNVLQSTSTQSCTDFAAGLPLSTIFIDTSKVGGSNNTTLGKYFVESKVTAIQNGLVRSGNSVSFDPAAAGMEAKAGQILELKGDLFSFVFEDAAILSDGTRADLKITYSDAKIAIDQRLGVSASGTNSEGPWTLEPSAYQGEISLANGSSFSYNGTDKRYLGTSASVPNSYIDAFTPEQRKAMADAVTAVAGQYNKSDGTQHSGGGTNGPVVGLTMDATYQIIKKTGEPADGTFIFAMAGINLDRDPYQDSGNNYGKPLWYYNDLPWGEQYHFFSESISINGGVVSDYIYVRPNTGIKEKSDASTSANYYPQIIRDTNGNVRFIGNAYNANGYDTTYSTGFVLLGNANGGLRVTATGHGGGGASMNTQVFSAAQIWYHYTHTTGLNGTIYTTSEGNHGGGLNDGGNTLDPKSYVVPEGKTVTYTMNPDKEYQIAKLLCTVPGGAMQEITYNGDPLSTMKDGDTLTFRDANNRDCTLTALDNGDGGIRFTLVVPYAGKDEKFHVEWERTIAKLTVKKETTDSQSAKFTFKVKAMIKEVEMKPVLPERIGSLWINRADSTYQNLFEPTATCSKTADALAADAASVLLVERVTIDAGKYLWKTNKKLSDYGITCTPDDVLYVTFENAASASIGNSLAHPLNVGYDTNYGPEVIQFYHPHTTPVPVVSYWNFQTGTPQDDDPQWYTFELEKDESAAFNIQQKYRYEVEEVVPDGWELLSVDGVVGANCVAGYLTEETNSAPEHVYLNRNIPDLIIEKETVNNAPGSFDFNVKFTMPAVPEQRYTVTGKAVIEDGKLTYSFINHGAAFAMDGVIVPKGTFPYGRTDLLDSKVCARLMTLSSASSDAEKAIVLGTQDGIVSAATATSLADWTESQKASDGTYPHDGSYIVTYTFASPARDAENYELPVTPDLAVYDSTNKQYSITVDNGASYTFYNLPVGLEYEVEEIVPNGWELKESENAKGTMADSNDVTAKFTNERLLDLTIRKTVSGSFGNKEQRFLFHLSLKDVNDNPVTDLPPLLDSLGDPLLDENGEPVLTELPDGVYAFRLGHGEELTIPLSWGTKYSLTELDSGTYAVNIDVSGADTEGVTKEQTNATVSDDILTDSSNVLFDNRLEASPPTGIRDDLRPALAGMGIATLLFAILLLARRRRT